MKTNKLLAWVLMAFVALTGVAFASPINVEDVTVQENNGNYLVVVTMTNPGTDSSGVFSEVLFTINELGTTKSLGVVKVANTGYDVFTYNLKDITDSLNLMKKGQTYTITVETDGNAFSKAFQYGAEQSTSGLGLLLEEIKVNSVTVSDVDSVQVMNGESVNVELRINAIESFDDARLMVFVEGYEHAPITASTEIFQVVAGKTYIKTLTLNLPADMNNQKDYKLRLVGANDLSGVTYKELSLYVDTERHRVDVLDLVMTPSSGVEPGQNIIANVRMKNRGQKSQDSVKINVAIPELGVSESSYISNLNSDEVATSDDMLLFVPEKAQAKTYDVEVTLSYDDGYTSTTNVYQLNVLSPRMAADENLLVSFKNNVDLVAGSQTSFDIVIANPNSDSKPISVVPVDAAWADVEVTPTLVMVQGGDSAVFTVKVTPKSAAAGGQDLTLVVKEGADTVNEFTVSTFVDGNQINWLNVVLVVLLILAIIVLLALVITIAKRRNENDDEETSSSDEEYY